MISETLAWTYVYWVYTFILLIHLHLDLTGKPGPPGAKGATGVRGPSGSPGDAGKSG